MRTKQEKEHTRNAHKGDSNMVRLARESLAFASVTGFVWMMCLVAQLVG
jgi:hypothetical protein